MKIQIELKGFTPLLDVLVKGCGLVTASVYGIVWRYAQMEDKVCRASLEKIGNRLDISGKTVERHIKKLCAEGYLEDLSPKTKNKPHIYIVTGKAELAGAISSEIRSDRKSDLDQSGQTESLTRSDRESYPGQTESPMKIHDKKQNKILAQNHQKDALNGLADQIASICKIDIDMVSKRNRDSLKAVTLALLEKPDVSRKLLGYSAWWYANDWRGQRGQSPTPSQVGDTWGQYEDTAQQPAIQETLTDAQQSALEYYRSMEGKPLPKQ